MVELGRIDISYEVSVLSWYLVHPKTGHVVQSLYMFKYLDIHKESNLDFNPEIYELSDPLTIERKI